MRLNLSLAALAIAAIVLLTSGVLSGFFGPAPSPSLEWREIAAQAVALNNAAAVNPVATTR
jgi:hypothetical protein